MKENAKTYIISIVTAIAVGGLSTLLTRNGMNSYSEITTPAFPPSSVLFL